MGLDLSLGLRKNFTLKIFEAKDTRILIERAADLREAYETSLTLERMWVNTTLCVTKRINFSIQNLKLVSRV